MSALIANRQALPLQFVFLFDLIQDINVLRPLVRLLAMETSHEILLLVSHKLARRDRTGTWRAELDELAGLTRARMNSFDSPVAARKLLEGRSGVIFSSSETNLPAHGVNHEVFLAAPADYVRVTIQHGHECVGFRQNHEQTVAHGDRVRFAADVVCGWGPLSSMAHMGEMERAKYFELGPPMVLDRLFNRPRAHDSAPVGLVCENLHSVRMRTTGDFQSTYIETIRHFADSQARLGRRIALRPHPGGQFVVKNKIELPGNVDLANAPMFKTDLSRFSYGISAPSSVLIDMVMAGIPTAVWHDSESLIDTSGYDGLARVSSVEDWIAFAAQAVDSPETYVEHQRAFLKRNDLDVAPELVRTRFLALVAGLTAPFTAMAAGEARQRILLVVNGVMPTLKISFLMPLHDLEEAGAVQVRIVTEAEIKQAMGPSASEADRARFARALVDGFAPHMAVFCRYSGPAADELVAELRASQVPVIFHIDDDLLNVPADIGAKHVEHNRPERTGTVRHLLTNADLVYCSTENLKLRLAELGFSQNVEAGQLYCSGEVIRAAQPGPVRTIGFMGNDKTPELTDLVDSIEIVLDHNPEVSFELFGSMGMPDRLLRFGDRVRAIPRVTDYDEFVAAFRQCDWQIGLAPLRPTPFNVVKADTKWVDYTTIGVATVASAGTAYDRCCADGAGVLVDEGQGWADAIQALIDDPDRRFRQVVAAQERLVANYSLQQLTRQVLTKFDRASAIARASAVADSSVVKL